MNIWLKFKALFQAPPEHTRAPYPPHPLNVPGDFYVESDCCLTCGIPMDIAPGLFAWENPSTDVNGVLFADSCYVCKQPSTPEDLKKMMEVMATQELGCIRYSGKDPAMIERIRKEGGEGFCDEEIDVA